MLQVPTAMLPALSSKFLYNAAIVYVLMSAPSATMPGWKHLGTKFKLVGMPDINTRDAFHGVLGGVGGIAHVAIDMDMNTHSQRIIDETVKSNLQLLNVAAKEPSVKSVVIMSSSAACALPTTGVPCKVNLKTWNNAVIEQTTSPWHSEGNSRWHGIIPYEASKVRGEQEASAWVREHNLAFSSNRVSRNVNVST